MGMRSPTTRRDLELSGRRAITGVIRLANSHVVRSLSATDEHD
jgi:hypothetical protein